MSNDEHPLYRVLITVSRLLVIARGLKVSFKPVLAFVLHLEIIFPGLARHLTAEPKKLCVLEGHPPLIGLPFLCPLLWPSFSLPALLRNNIPKFCRQMARETKANTLPLERNMASKMSTKMAEYEQLT